MYEQFFLFDEPPFNLTPDSKFVYLSPGHQEALEHMIYGISQRKGFILIAGDIGAGKTTLTRLFLDKLDENVKTALIFNTFLNEIELLRTINKEFGISADSDSREQLIEILNEFLIRQLEEGGNAILIIDEAQNLAVEVLEQIRMLSNLETETEKLIQIILVGQPELADTLAMPNLAQLNQRVTVRCHLHPMNYEDTIRYIHHRISVAGPQSTVRFSSGAYKFIYRLSSGVPRRINALCDRALLVAFAGGSQNINKKTVIQADKEVSGPGVRLRKPARDHQRLSWWGRLTSGFETGLVRVFILALLVVLVSYLGYTNLFKGYF